LRPKELPGGVGVGTVFIDMGDEDEDVRSWGFDHCSQSCDILFKAVFRPSARQNKERSHQEKHNIS